MRGTFANRPADAEPITLESVRAAAIKVHEIIAPLPELRALAERVDISLTELATEVAAQPCGCWMLRANGEPGRCISCRSREYCRELRGLRL